MSLGPQADAARLGVAAGGGGAGAVHDHLRLRRRVDEPQGHAAEPRVARDHRRLHRGGHARPRLRRARRLRRLRQDAARHHDGDGAAQCPSVFVYGGAMLPGRWRESRRDRAHGLRGRGRGAGGHHDTRPSLRDLERACAPTVGSCPGQFTANTMAMVSEALGLALPGSAMLPAVYSERLALGAPRRPARDGDPRAAAARCRAISSPANRWRMRPRRWRQPAARPMPACICRRSRTRPASASRSTTSPRCSPARR